MPLTSIEQSLLNSVVYAQILIDSWDEIEQSKIYEPRYKLKFHLKGFKEEAEKLIKDFWKNVPKEQELDFIHLIKERIELLKAFDQGKVEIPYNHLTYILITYSNIYKMANIDLKLDDILECEFDTDQYKVIQVYITMATLQNVTKKTTVNIKKDFLNRYVDCNLGIFIYKKKDNSSQDTR